MIRINHYFSYLHGIFNILVYVESKSILSATCLHVYYVDYVFFKGDYVFTKQIFFCLQTQKLRSTVTYVYKRSCLSITACKVMVYRDFFKGAVSFSWRSRCLILWNIFSCNVGTIENRLFKKHLECLFLKYETKQSWAATFAVLVDNQKKNLKKVMVNHTIWLLLMLWTSITLDWIFCIM